MLKASGYGEAIIGYAMSFTGFGALIGAVVCARLMRSFGTPALMGYWGIYGVAIALLPAFTASAQILLLACFAVGWLGAFVDVMLPTNIQRLSTKANLGKNFGLFSTLANTGEALSGGFAGGLAAVASAGASVTILGILVAVTAYIGKLKTVPRRA
jgi:predicted MFS family arabinose efflux permease